MRGRECQRGSPAARVADEMEPIESVRFGLAQYPFDLGVETVVGWRSPSTSSSAPYAGAAGSTLPGNSTTACRIATV